MGELTLSLDKYADDLESLLKNIPGMRRELHAELGQMMKSKLDANIASSLNDDKGKIRSWQMLDLGSGGGYAAVRPIKGSGKKGPGAITGYLERGHRIRNHKTGQKYRPRIKVPGAYVSGRHFYAATQNGLEERAISMISEFADKLAKRIEGGGE